MVFLLILTAQVDPIVNAPTEYSYWILLLPHLILMFPSLWDKWPIQNIEWMYLTGREKVTVSYFSCKVSLWISVPGICMYVSVRCRKRWCGEISNLPWEGEGMSFRTLGDSTEGTQAQVITSESMRIALYFLEAEMLLCEASFLSRISPGHNLFWITVKDISPGQVHLINLSVMQCLM